ncbi:MAG TPA: TonB-dependent receptor [Sphingopyxis sp.]|uniref:TonB-dependent receptor n=1 Tax=Sphingopyxis sp. TaxID=1908224 RepID=UPI002E343647|nr:TonB-dependent receptor [Sphingopyxis sp.]HEX2814261.1 TonB-dependent receptor [Sphingopyxis sp.]
MKTVFLLLSTAAIALAATPAQAQSADSAASGDDSSVAAPTADSYAGDIVVTAQRRSESIQNVPIAISAFNAEMVESSGSTNITSLNGIAPNVVLQTQGLVANVPMISIRGMSTSDPDPNADPKVSTIIDGVYIPFVSSTMLDLFDIERVEVLKGPQGVLFGKNNLAGTLNVITARPAEDFGGEVRVTLGSFGLKQFRGKLNSGRFADGALAAKVSVNFRDYNGYSRNVITGNRLNGANVKSVRGALNYDQGGAFNSTIVADWLKQKTTGPAPHVLDNGDANWDLLPKAAREDVRKSAILFDPYANTETYGGSWTSNLDVGYGTITSVLGYRHLSYVTRGDFDGLITPAPNLDVIRDFSGESKSGELRYVSPAGEPVDFVVGLYYQADKWRQFNTVFASPTLTTLAQLHQDTESYAAFALVNAHPVDGLTLSLGGRYSHDRKKYSIATQVRTNTTPVGNLTGDAYTQAVMDSLLSGAQISSFAADLKASWAEFTPRLTVEYRMSPSAMIYANYSQGYKAGGFNSRGTIAENVGPYDPERVNAFEVGAKTDLFDRLLRLNVAGFVNNYRNLQGSVTKMGAVRAENITTNIAAAKIYGFEVETLLRPADGFTIGANLAYLHARYTDFCADTNGVFTNGAPEVGQCGPAEPILINGVPNGTFSVPTDSTGLDLANAPKWSGSLSVDYAIPVSFGEVKLHSDARYSSRFNTWGRSNNPGYYRDEVVLLNASIAVAGEDDRWKVTVYGSNLTDQKVISGATNAGATPISQFYQPPREFGVDFAVKF